MVPVLLRYRKRYLQYRFDQVGSGMPFQYHQDFAFSAVNKRAINRPSAETMKNWYANITNGQKVFLYLVSSLLILVYGLGLIPLVVLIYLQLGVQTPAKQE
ncbi:hypothetical protein [Paraburkholderia sp. 40]|uniref:hypothetical protein n=1 Tax=Paraburkholderia sp. 40 TaxID=2991059 RepID=UPI003D1BFF3D